MLNIQGLWTLEPARTFLPSSRLLDFVTRSHKVAYAVMTQSCVFGLGKADKSQRVVSEEDNRSL